MHVERLWPDTRLRNYHYLVVCRETGEALAIDPWDANLVLATARAPWLARSADPQHPPSPRSRGRQRGPARGHRRARAGACRRGVADRRRGPGLADGDVIRVGRSVRARMPRYAGPHDVACVPAGAWRPPALFSGDTLFNAGAGNCHNGGDPVALYETFADAAGEAARPHRGARRPRLHAEQPGLHARPRAATIRCREGLRTDAGRPPGTPTCR